MNTTLKLTLALAGALIMTGASASYAQKLAYINTPDVIDVMPEVETVDQRLQAYQQELSDMLESIQVEWNNKYVEYQKGLNTYTDSVRQLKEKELQDLQTRFGEFQQTAQQDFQKMQAELYNPIFEKIREAINKVAKEQQITAVFDVSAGSLAYYDEDGMINLFPFVKRELGIAE